MRRLRRLAGGVLVSALVALGGVAVTATVASASLSLPEIVIFRGTFEAPGGAHRPQP
jgi:hypothetical protein